MDLQIYTIRKLVLNYPFDFLVLPQTLHDLLFHLAIIHQAFLQVSLLYHFGHLFTLSDED